MGFFGGRASRAAQFETTAAVHLDELVRAATTACRSREIAEDVVQETYLKAWKYWDSFETGTNCRAWLYKILFNVIRTRRGGRDLALVSLDAPEFAEVLPIASPESPTVTDLMRAVERLPEVYREPMILVTIEGFSYREAAQILEVPIGTVMSRLHRGRDAVRRAVEWRPKSSAAGGAVENRKAL